jgi:signal peptidase I
MRDNHEERTDMRRELFDWAQCLVASLILVIVIFTFFARIISVEGVSMTDTLQHQDRIVISNLLYTPRHGHVVVFTKPGVRSDDRVVPFIKRVIAVGGDEIRFNAEGSLYSVSVKYKGSDEFVKLDEPYIREPMRFSNFDPDRESILIPEGTLFVLGDNRNGSQDSRHADIGFVDARCVMGRLLFRLWPNPSRIIGGF